VHAQHISENRPAPRDLHVKSRPVLTVRATPSQELASQYPETWQKAWLSHVTKPFQAVRVIMCCAFLCPHGEHS